MDTAEPEGYLHAYQRGGFDACPAQPALHHVGNPDIDGANETARCAPWDGFASVAGRLLHRHQQVRLSQVCLKLLDSLSLGHDLGMVEKLSDPILLTFPIDHVHGGCHDDPLVLGCPVVRLIARAE